MTNSTVCLISEICDRQWLENFRPDARTVFVALTAEGQYVAEALGLKYYDCAELMDELSKNKCHDESRRLSVTWHRTLSDQVSELKELHMFDGYPLLDMLQSHLVLVVWELLEAFTLALALIEKLRPSKIVAGGRQSPFVNNRLFLVTGSRGLERECLATIARQAGIPFKWMQPSRGRSERQGTLKCQAGTQRGQGARSGRIWDRLMAVIRGLRPSRSTANVGPTSNVGATVGEYDVLFYLWGDHHLDEIGPVIYKLRGEGCRILVILIGGSVTERHRVELEAAGVPVLFRETLPLTTAQCRNLDRVCKLAHRAASRIARVRTPDRLFMRGGFSFFADLFVPIVCNELLQTLPEMCHHLYRAETLLERASP